jgi:hypothetical protein
MYNPLREGEDGEETDEELVREKVIPGKKEEA